MRAVVQRVTRAQVEVDDQVVGEIGTGLMVLLGVTHDDTVETAARLAAKIWTLRILRDEQSAADLGAGVLVVSQFTLYGDARKGRRPSWTAAAPGPVAEPLYDEFCAVAASPRRAGRRGRVRRRHGHHPHQRRAHHTGAGDVSRT